MPKAIGPSKNSILAQWQILINIPMRKKIYFTGADTRLHISEGEKVCI